MEHLVLSPPKFVKRFSTLLEPLLSRYPEFLSSFHDVGQNSTSKEDHMLSTGWIFDPDFEFLSRKQSNQWSSRMRKMDWMNIRLVGMGRRLVLS